MAALGVDDTLELHIDKDAIAPQDMLEDGSTCGTSCTIDTDESADNGTGLVFLFTGRTCVATCVDHYFGFHLESDRTVSMQQDVWVMMRVWFVCRSYWSC